MEKSPTPERPLYPKSSFYLQKLSIGLLTSSAIILPLVRGSVIQDFVFFILNFSRSVLFCANEGPVGEFSNHF